MLYSELVKKGQRYNAGDNEPVSSPKWKKEEARQDAELKAWQNWISSFPYGNVEEFYWNGVSLCEGYTEVFSPGYSYVGKTMAELVAIARQRVAQQSESECFGDC